LSAAVPHIPIEAKIHNTNLWNQHLLVSNVLYTDR
jgi:hypothetical protein